MTLCLRLGKYEETVDLRLSVPSGQRITLACLWAVSIPVSGSSAATSRTREARGLFTGLIVVRNITGITRRSQLPQSKHFEAKRPGSDCVSCLGHWRIASVPRVYPENISQSVPSGPIQIALLDRRAEQLGRARWAHEGART